MTAVRRRLAFEADSGEGGLGRHPTVCLYTRSANPSGMGEHMVDLLEGFTDRARLYLLARRLPKTKRLLDGARAAGATVVEIPGPHDPTYAASLADFYRHTRVDLVHGHAGWGWEDPDGFRVPREQGIRRVVVTHHLPFLLHSKPKAARMRQVAAHVDAHVAVSHGLRRSYERIGLGEAQWHTVPNGVRPRGADCGRSAARRALGLDDGALVVMTTGRLVLMKGQRYLVEATAALAEAHPRLVTVIVGDGDLAGDLRRRAHHLGVGDRVVLPGHRSDARSLLDAADVFALPSRSEGMPLAALEAMDAGLPVVGTRVIGTEEVVQDGETGRLVPPENSAELAAALDALLSDPDLRGTWGAAGRRYYRREHSVELMVERTWAVYDRVGARGVPARTAPTP